ILQSQSSSAEVLTPPPPALTPSITMLPIQPGILRSKLPGQSTSLLRHNMKQKKYKLISKTQVVAFLILLFVFSANTAGANTGSLPTQAGPPLPPADLDTPPPKKPPGCKEVFSINTPPGG